MCTCLPNNSSLQESWRRAFKRIWVCIANCSKAPLVVPFTCLFGSFKKTCENLLHLKGRYLLNALQLPNVIQGVQRRGEATMQAKNLQIWNMSTINTSTCNKKSCRPWKAAVRTFTQMQQLRPCMWLTSIAPARTKQNSNTECTNIPHFLPALSVASNRIDRWRTSTH